MDDQTQQTPPPEPSPESRLGGLESRMEVLEGRFTERESQPVTQPSGDFTHSGIELVGRHTPESHVEIHGPDDRRKVELPGTYEVGALIEGAFIPLVRLKAAEVLEAIERAKQSDSERDAPQE